MFGISLSLILKTVNIHNLSIKFPKENLRIPIMSRNDVRKMILSVINDASLLESDRNAKVNELFCHAEKKFGYRQANRLAKQIQKESGFDMSNAMLLKAVDE